jgi:3-oxoadipate enol-lactonase
MLVKTDDGAQIYVEAAADDGKPPLLFSNSLGTNLHMWDPQTEAFGESFRIVRYDSRGHGRSDAPEGLYTIERLGCDAVAILDALDIERACFCGLSKGGMVGQWLGANAPERIVRMALCSTAAYIPAPDLWNHRIEVATTRGMPPLTDGIIERWFTESFRKDNPAEVERIGKMLLSTPGIGYAGCCAAIRDMDQREAIKGIKLPTLVVAGEKDPATPPERGLEIHKLIDGSKFFLLDAAHLSNIEKPDAFNRAVLEFLTQ